MFEIYFFKLLILNFSLTNKISKITKANQKDGGDGAFYVFLKNNTGITE